MGSSIESAKPNKTPGDLGYVFSRPVLKRSFLIALVVGSILSLANQSDVIARGPFTLLLGMKLFFNFLVPFTVSSVSAVMNRERT